MSSIEKLKKSFERSGMSESDATKLVDKINRGVRINDDPFLNQENKQVVAQYLGTIEAIYKSKGKTAFSNKLKKQLTTIQNTLSEANAKAKKERDYLIDEIDKDQQEQTRKTQAEHNQQRQNETAKAKAKGIEEGKKIGREEAEAESQSHKEAEARAQAERERQATQSVKNRFSAIIRDLANQGIAPEAIPGLLQDEEMRKKLVGDEEPTPELMKEMMNAVSSQQKTNLKYKGLYDKIAKNPALLQLATPDLRNAYNSSNYQMNTVANYQNSPSPINYINLTDPHLAPRPKKLLTSRMYWQVKNM